MKALRNAACPCGSGEKAKRCCLPVIAGEPAKDPTSLLRARFCAYGWGAVAYLMETSSGEAAQTDAAGLAAYCADLTLVRLDIGPARAEGDAGFVSYTAHLVIAGRPLVLREDAQYTRRDGRWTYSGGAVRGAGP